MIARLILGATSVAAAVVTIACAPGSVPASASAPFGLARSDVDASPEASAESSLVRVRVLAFNDFHGNLLPPVGSHGVVFASTDDSAVSARALPRPAGSEAPSAAAISVGGAAYLAAHVTKLRAETPNAVIVSAGDLTGGSPLISALFADEPTVLVMNAIGLDFEGLGNHDLDRGVFELRRRQSGGCEFSGCDAGSFQGATFRVLAANAIEVDAGRPLFQPYAIKEFGAARVAFIGETLRGTPSVTTASAVEGLAFKDEAGTANALVPELKKAGVSAIVLLLHQGGAQSSAGTYDSCVGLTGDLLPILDNLSPEIEVVVSGHTHQAYNCLIGGRVVTSAASYGRIVTAIDLTLDPVGRRIVEKRARNVPVTRDLAPDEAVGRLVSSYEERARGVSERVVGYVARDITGSSKVAHVSSCETPLGDVIADAMRAATRADFAFMNPGGIRADLVAKRPRRAPNQVTFGDAFEVQPFSNRLVTVTLTGAQIKSALEVQFKPQRDPRILQVSRELTYRYAFDRREGKAIITELRLRGSPLSEAATARVAMPSFLAEGGDGFAVFKSGRDPDVGPIDVDALVEYLGKSTSPAKPLDPQPEPRIRGDGC